MRCRWGRLLCAKGARLDEGGIATSPTAIQRLMLKSSRYARPDETSGITGSPTANCLLQLNRARCARERQFMPASAAWYTVPMTRRQVPSIRLCRW